MPDASTSVASAPPQASRPATGNRSPNYPQLGVGSAIDKAKKMYEKEYKHSMPAQVAVEALGYKSLSGTAKSVLSTLRKYGLVTFDGKDGYKVSDDTVAIAELPLEDPERNASIRRVALRPAAYKQLAEKYGATLPSDGAIRHFLIQSGYQSDGANLLIKVYKETLDFLAKIPAVPTPEAAQQPNADVKQATDLGQTPSASTTAPLTTPATTANTFVDMPGTDRHQVRLSSKCTAEIVLKGEVTTEAIEKLKGYLEWVQSGYPSETQTMQPKHSVAKTDVQTQPVSLFDEADEELDEGDDFEEDDADE